MPATAPSARTEKPVDSSGSSRRQSRPPTQMQRPFEPAHAAIRAHAHDLDVARLAGPHAAADEALRGRADERRSTLEVEQRVGRHVELHGPAVPGDLHARPAAVGIERRLARHDVAGPRRSDRALEREGDAGSARDRVAAGVPGGPTVLDQCVLLTHGAQGSAWPVGGLQSVLRARSAGQARPGGV